MSCLFENDNKISTCKIDEGKKRNMLKNGKRSRIYRLYIYKNKQ